MVSHSEIHLPQPLCKPSDRLLDPNPSRGSFTKSAPLDEISRVVHEEADAPSDISDFKGLDVGGSIPSSDFVSNRDK
ncbi:hypothetical protein ANCCEY_08487 [Ancylostoma ceylanicum]|uniref:Uncharacterized protein n=1 Tax=Ancylostoma ceylanicum TaxID=53326 RepID=A0A0D6LQX4_9BILA|nr:hypothetical protein ANCCEY_08487 [Ancylostoma ceylanicum]